ncbi:MAG: hypothetical protein H0W88_02705 [Parachlamydiaceae bacterium]|nr:hypothetical protein [Parachlamydiaceae bacterium]
MQKWITFLMTLLVGSVSYANADAGTEVDFEAGYRRDNISWTVQAPACDPLFRSHTKFEDIDIFQIGVHGRANVGCNLYVRGSASGGWILDGDFKEKTNLFFNESDFSAEFGSVDEIGVGFRSADTVDGKFVVDLSAAVGYPFYFCDCTMEVAPVIGYGFNEQSLRVERRNRRGFDNSSSFLFAENDNCDRGGCCNEHFISRWYGPFIGVDFVYNPCNDCWSLWAELEYHWARNKTKRREFAGFDNFGEFDNTARHAHGWVFNVGADYAFCHCWTVGMSVKVQDWGSTRRHRECGRDSSNEFFGSDTKVKTHVQWHSFAVSLDLGRQF